MMNKSEVARLRQQIEWELEAMRRGLTGLAQGVSSHTFIHARMERINTCRYTLAGHVGEAEATQLVCTLYMRAMEQETQNATT
ncbi:hypothetical protein EPA93_47050 [Ktedonosporobacter rubrisoli]|uniref:Uncharacterized protein n=1 Tax=Ktedonosporobacter rubrisoli TaxID=2509675 RepID=A0A4P6K567_KTERU|nr:hypothetical protein [Ktedonosporobacter rubrisoli]QBD83122.1 hypothetical protein EPA93_47050 [Ktedonosporobacter rubrisoli]